MADATPSIFNKKAAEKLRNPDDLDKFVRVTNPSVWVVLAACVCLIAGLLAWGIFGSMTTSISTTGAVVDISAVAESAETYGLDKSKTAICFLSAKDVAEVSVGDDAVVGGVPMKVQFISPIPASPDEWDNVLKSKYLAKALFDGDWAYPVAFEGDISQLEDNVPLTAVITTDRIAPVSLILKNWE